MGFTKLKNSNNGKRKPYCDYCAYCAFYMVYHHRKGNKTYKQGYIRLLSKGMEYLKRKDVLKIGDRIEYFYNEDSNSIALKKNNNGVGYLLAPV